MNHATKQLHDLKVNGDDTHTRHDGKKHDEHIVTTDTESSQSYQRPAIHSTSTTMNYSPSSNSDNSIYLSNSNSISDSNSNTVGGNSSNSTIGTVIVDGDVTYVKPTIKRLPSDSSFFQDLKIQDNDIPNSPTDSELQNYQQQQSASLNGTLHDMNGNGSNSDSEEAHRKHECIQSPEYKYHIDCELPSDLAKQIHELQPLIKQFRHDIQSYARSHPNSLYVRNAIHDDEFVYRFLIARNKQVHKSVDMFIEACDYRELHDIDHILERPLPNGIEIMQYAQQAVHSFDKHGRPVLIERVGSQHAREMYDKYGFEGRCYYHQYLMEYLVRHVMPQASCRAGRRITQVVIVVDLKGLHMGQVFKTNYSFVKYVAKCNSLLYPEYLHTTFVIGIPRIFSFVWNIVKGWIDEKTRNKIAIIHGNGLSEATKLIDKNHYPRIFGGDCKCTACTTGDGSQLWLAPETQEFARYVKDVNGKFPEYTAAPNHKLNLDMLTRVKTGN